MGKPPYIKRYTQDEKCRPDSSASSASRSTYASSTTYGDEESSIGSSVESALDDLEPGEQRWGPSARSRWQISVGLCIGTASGIGIVLAPPLDLGRLIVVNVHKGLFHSDTEVFLYPTGSGFVDAHGSVFNKIVAEFIGASGHAEPG